MNDSTTISCTTGAKTDSVVSGLKITQNGQVFSFNSANVHVMYLHKWSNTNTWGGENVPRDGDSVYIPKGMSVEFDLQRSGVLKAILIEGTLIFKPDIDVRHFDANYILVKGGYL